MRNVGFGVVFLLVGGLLFFSGCLEDSKKEDKQQNQQNVQYGGIKGKVIVGSGSAGGVTVSVLNTQAMTVTAEDGTFVMENQFAAGTYTVTFSVENGSHTEQEAVVVSGVMTDMGQVYLDVGNLNVSGLLNPIVETGHIRLEGDLAGGVHTDKSWLEKIWDRVVLFFLPRKVYAFEASEIKKVLVFSSAGGFESYYLSYVTDEGFVIDVNRSAPVGLIFADGENRFKGYMTLGSGLDTLPLHTVDENITTIDFESLYSTGEIVEPSHNPLGSEMIISQAALDVLALADDFFASTVQNPDVDGNGQIDLLEGKRFDMWFNYEIVAGKFSNGALTPELFIPPGFVQYDLHLEVVDPTGVPASVKLIGPDPLVEYSLHHPIENVQEEDFNYSVTDATSSGYVLYPPYYSPIPPEEGAYRIIYKDSNLTYNLPDQSSARENIVFPLPSVHLNPDGTIHKISWVYTKSDGTPLPDPTVVIKEFYSFWISSFGQIAGCDCTTDCATDGCNIYYSGYDSHTSVNDTEHVLRCQTFVWDQADAIAYEYSDIYGNRYSVRFYRQNVAAQTINIMKGEFILDNQTATYVMAEPPVVADNVIIPIPSIHLNSDGTMRSMSWHFIHSDGSESDEIPAGMTTTILGSGELCPESPEFNLPQANTMYRNYLINEPWGLITSEHNFSCQNLQWDDVGRVILDYGYGNRQYQFFYDKSFNR